MDVLDLITKEGLRRGLSPRTIATYRACVKLFLRSCRKEIQTITKGDIRSYLDTLIERGMSGNTLNVSLCALKFLFEEILCKRLLLYFKYSKIPKTLPTVLSRDETLRLFHAIRNVKHSLAVRLMYAAGLRVSELTHLRVEDLMLGSGYGWVRRGKGGKDRMFVLPSALEHELGAYIRAASIQPGDWLFPGRRHQPFHAMSIHQIVKKAARRAGISKNVHCHTLRHSFATHLIEGGYSLADVQSLLGHSQMTTTMRYIHLASPALIHVRSPYDALDHRPQTELRR